MRALLLLDVWLRWMEMTDGHDDHVRPITLFPVNEAIKDEREVFSSMAHLMIPDDTCRL